MSLSTVVALKDTAILFAVNDTDAFTDSKADVDATASLQKNKPLGNTHRNIICRV